MIRLSFNTMFSYIVPVRQLHG